MKSSLIRICLSVMLTAAVVNTIAAEGEDQYRPPLPKKLSLPEAKRIALQANPSLQITVARLQAAASQLQQAQSNYMPTLDLTASVQRTQEVPKQNGGNGRSHFTTYNAGASFDWTLYDGMARKYDNIAKRAGLKMTRCWKSRTSASPRRISNTIWTCRTPPRRNWSAARATVRTF